MTRLTIVAALGVTLLAGACAVPPPSATVAQAPATPPTTLVTLMTRARAGDDRAAVAVAVLYYRAGNAVEAFQWLRIAANRGSSLAQAGLGHAYTLGLGVPQDYSLALKYCHLAADQNDASGLNNLAYLYERGLGVPADLPKAAELYRRSAMQGNATAQEALGLLYEQGRGVPVDHARAYFWDSLAAARLIGPAMAIAAQHRDAMAAGLPPSVVASLQAAATQWKPGTEPPPGHPIPTGATKPHAA